MIILGVNDNRENGDRASRAKNAADRAGEKKFADTLTAHRPVSREPRDQGGKASSITAFNDRPSFPPRLVGQSRPPLGKLDLGLLGHFGAHARQLRFCSHAVACLSFGYTLYLSGR